MGKKKVDLGKCVWVKQGKAEHFARVVLPEKIKLHPETGHPISILVQWESSLSQDFVPIKDVRDDEDLQKGGQRSSQRRSAIEPTSAPKPPAVATTSRSRAAEDRPPPPPPAATERRSARASAPPVPYRPDGPKEVPNISASERRSTRSSAPPIPYQPEGPKKRVPKRTRTVSKKTAVHDLWGEKLRSPAPDHPHDIDHHEDDDVVVLPEEPKDHGAEFLTQAAEGDVLGDASPLKMMVSTPIAKKRSDRPSSSSRSRGPGGTMKRPRWSVPLRRETEFRVGDVVTVEASYFKKLPTAAPSDPPDSDLDEEADAKYTVVGESFIRKGRSTPSSSKGRPHDKDEIPARSPSRLLTLKRWGPAGAKEKSDDEMVVPWEHVRPWNLRGEDLPPASTGRRTKGVPKALQLFSPAAPRREQANGSPQKSPAKVHPEGEEEERESQVV